ncbi:hypothetical protein HY988_01765 [Candidatus Micrarchaeota archaeon]|nr:hypothetical protein [Candidatus Micrarchaeota archaeon]
MTDGGSTTARVLPIRSGSFWIPRGRDEAHSLMNRLPMLDRNFSPQGIADYQTGRLNGVGLSTHLLYALALSATGRVADARKLTDIVFTDREGGFWDPRTNTLNGEIGNSAGFRLTSEQMMGVVALKATRSEGASGLFERTPMPGEGEIGKRITNYFIAREDDIARPLGDDNYLSPELWHILALAAIGRTEEAQARMKAILRSLEFFGPEFFKCAATQNQPASYSVHTQLLAILALSETGNR